jgi:predicted nucleotidyltransferase
LPLPGQGSKGRDDHLASTPAQPAQTTYARVACYLSARCRARLPPRLRIARLHAVDRKGRTIDLAPVWPLLNGVLREWNPERIQLFGSRARGDANRDSDWDILVVVPEASVPADPLVPWRLRRDTGVRADVIVYSSSEFEAERDVPNTLAYEAASAGVALYER